MSLIPGIAQGAEPEGTVEKLDSAVVSVSRAGDSTPVTYTMVSSEQLRSVNPMNSLPMALALQPSVVTVNEGGTGLGYSKMTVRGSKGSQINVTLNGITLNDAESQEVFWVNIPALSSLLSSVQLQRGLGTSAAGPGAFGASINMSTASVGADPYASVDLGYGSYGTFTASAAVGTGLMKSGLYFDFAYSRGLTDGYIRNAFADVQSALAVLGWMNERNSLRLTWLFGDQHTGITWHGIDLAQYEADRRYNPAGEYYDAYGNVRYYDNDTDNYTQHHLQLNYTRRLAERLVWTSTFNWTKGDGYYENYKSGKSFSKYNFEDDREGDFIVREAMDNHYFVLNSDVRYTSDLLSVTGGVNLSRYDGDHIGKVLWSDVLGADYDYGSHKWYLNNGLKHEANAFVRAEWSPLAWMTAYADLQYRGVWLDMAGPEDDQIPLDYSTDWQFLNPRAGLSFHWDQHQKAYVSAALGHREPGRSDIKENIKNAWVAQQAGIDSEGVTLKPEKMLDVEVGYSYVSEKVSASANIYLMEYWDMLLETGRLSNVGYAIKENVSRSWRRGVELAASWQALPWLRADANLTLSLNRIKDYTEFVQHVDTYDYWSETGRTTAMNYGTTTMLMSPSVTGMARLSFSPWRGIASNSLKTIMLSLDGKYVGKQYMDNTMTDSRSIPAYFVSNLSLSYEIPLRKRSFAAAQDDTCHFDRDVHTSHSDRDARSCHFDRDGHTAHSDRDAHSCHSDRGGHICHFDRAERVEKSKLRVSFYINNLFNNMYYADGWCWKNIVEEDGALIDGIGVYPQAPLNFMLKLSWQF